MDKQKDVIEETRLKCAHYSKYGNWCTGDCVHCKNFTPKPARFIVSKEFKKTMYLD